MSPSRPRISRSLCPIATSLDQIGDRWSLVIIRDLLTGKKRFNDFLKSPENITTSVLSDRLATLESLGILSRKRYQERPPRYEYALTVKGRNLIPIVQALCTWGNQHMSQTWTPPADFMALRP